MAVWGWERNLPLRMCYIPLMIRSFQFRCRPTEAQKRALDDIAFKANAVYNAALEERIDCYRKWEMYGRWLGKSKREAKRGYYDQTAAIKAVRKENPEYAAFLIWILRFKARYLDHAFKAFFRRLKAGEKPGFPRFKSSFRPRQTLKLGEGVKWHKGKGNFGHIAFKGLPGKLRFKIHNPKFAGDDVTVKNTMLTRDHKGWRVTFQCELPNVQKQNIADFIGVDLGLEKFFAQNDGEIVARERFFDKSYARLRRTSRALSRRKNKRTGKQARLAHQRAHAKIANQRKSFHCRVAAALVAKALAEKKGIAVEDLNIKGLARGLFSRQFSDVALGQFLKRLECKAESAGVRVGKVDPRYTSQTCSVCGAIEKKSLSQRVHKCSACGHENDRDAEAAEIIRKKAVAGLGVETRAGKLRIAPTNLSLAFQ